ncbi:MAG: histidine phosphatase family protein [Planctomycetota bacterium]|nr:histidine phosphatase family protein [Planctomycetota bacterium]MDA1114151.1 histidine phosphatase family protein [Planctomycetota bacterium]
MRLFLIRHGAVSPARHGSFYGGTEVDLSPQGRIEAKNAAVQLQAIPLQALYASPLSRAQFGAEQVRAGRMDMEIRSLEGLKEIARGRWIGKTPNEVDAQYPADRESHRLDPWNWRAHEGESLGDLRTRVLACLTDIVQEHSGDGAVALVSHMFPIRAVLADAMHLDLPAWDDLVIPTGSVSCVEYNAMGEAKVLFLGRT